MKQTTLFEGQRTGVKELPQDTDVAMNTLIDSSKTRWHKSHRYLFVFEFEGVQPTRSSDSLVKIGRYRSIPQARYDFHEEKAIVFTLPHTIKIWVKHPGGVKTSEQLIEARQRAWRVAQTLASKHAIVNLREREAGFSEHTIEQANLDKAVRPIVIAEPELAKEKLGLSINQTSHKGKVEWTGPNAKERVMKLELWLDKGQDVMFAEFERINSTLDKLLETLRGPKPPEPPAFEGGGMYG